jgi:hypothetical protein
LEFEMNIELEEVVLLDVSDDELEMAAGGAQGGCDPLGWGVITHWVGGGAELHPQ